MTNAIHADEKQSREGLLFGCVPGMARFLLVKVQSQVFTAERSGAQAVDSNGYGGGSA